MPAVDGCLEDRLGVGVTEDVYIYSRNIMQYLTAGGRLGEVIKWQVPVLISRDDRASGDDWEERAAWVEMAERVGEVS